MPDHTIAENLTRLQTARTNIATAITTKGGTVAAGAGFEDFSTAIGTIPAGGGSSGDAVITTRSKGFVPTNNVDWVDVSWTIGNTAYGNNSFFVGDDFYIARDLSTGGTYYKFAPDARESWTLVASLHTSAALTSGCFWSDGTDIYASSVAVQLVLDKTNLTWSAKTWTGLTNFSGVFIWTDGTDIFYSSSTDHYVLDKSTSTWSTKTWTGLTDFDGKHIWTDGTDVYYSYDSNQYVLDKATSTWSAKTWSGFSNVRGEFTWTDGNSLYYSGGPNQYVLDKATSTWSAKTWTGITSFTGSNICYNGAYICYISQGTSSSSAEYKMLKNTKRLPY